MPVQSPFAASHDNHPYAASQGYDVSIRGLRELIPKVLSFTNTIQSQTWADANAGKNTCTCSTFMVI
jgi:hypothetical protein